MDFWSAGWRSGGQEEAYLAECLSPLLQLRATAHRRGRVGDLLEDLGTAPKMMSEFKEWRHVVLISTGEACLVGTEQWAGPNCSVA